MQKTKNEYYSLRTKLLPTNANYCCVISERTNGKSWSAKDVALERYFKMGYRCALVRRMETETRKDFTDSYFSDMTDQILFYSGGEYDCVIRYGATLYFAKRDEETGKCTRGRVFGRILWLSGAEHFKSQALKEIGTLIMEEFITSEGYLPREPSRLMSIVSTIARDRMDVLIIMIGNTVNRQCPYFYEWGLRNIYKQEQGTVDVYHVDDVVVAVERPDPIVRKSLVIGKARKMAVNGEWDVEDAPIIRIKDNSQILYTLYIIVYDLTYGCELCITNNGCPRVRFRPHDGKIPEWGRVVDTRDKAEIDSVLHTKKLSEVTKGDKAIRLLLSRCDYGFSDLLTAAELRKIIPKLM